MYLDSLWSGIAPFAPDRKRHFDAQKQQIHELAHETELQIPLKLTGKSRKPYTLSAVLYIGGNGFSDFAR